MMRLPVTAFAIGVAAAAAGAVPEGYTRAKPPAERIELVNPGFERGTEGWVLSPGYDWDPKGGRNGTGALRITRTDPAYYALGIQVLKLRPGGRYRFSAWVRTEGVKGDDSGAGVCLEYSGLKGWMGGAYPDGIKGTRDWTKVEGVVQVAPDATSCTITPYMRRGMTGTAWIDDVRVEPEAAAWSAYLILPRMETLPPAGGRLVFGSRITGDLGHGDGALSCLVEVLDAKGAATGEQATAPVQGNRIEAKIGTLPAGKASLRLALLDPGRKLVLAEETIPVAVADPAPGRPCVIADDGRAVVDGKPFLPVGLYASGIQKDDIARLKESPFNCVMPYASLSMKLDGSKSGQPEGVREVLDACHAAGIRVIFSLKDVFAGTRWETLEFAGAKGEEAVIERAVREFREHPAVLAWYVNDELPTTMLDRLTARRRLVNALDPGHPTWAVLYQFEELALYGPTCDVLGVDPYPIRDRGTRDMALVLRAMEASEDAVGTPAGTALWVVPQAFSWGTYDAPDREEMLKRNRYPTEDEMRAMSLLAAIKGARGFILYSYFDLFRENTKPDLGKRWPEICRVGKVLRSLEPYLLSEGPSSPVKLVVREGKVEARAFASDAGRRCVLVAGIGPGKAAAVLDLDPSVRWRSRYGLTKLITGGKWRFTGTDICSDILEEK